MLNRKNSYPLSFAPETYILPMEDQEPDQEWYMFCQVFELALDTEEISYSGEAMHSWQVINWDVHTTCVAVEIVAQKTDAYPFTVVLGYDSDGTPYLVQM